MNGIYERVGGEDFFVHLVDLFYAGVATDPLLRPMYPDDLTEPKANLALFLMQYWGGPGTYMEKRGHPRMRMRHAPYVVDQAARDAWMGHMTAAINDAGVEPEVAAIMLDYFENAATFLVNT